VKTPVDPLYALPRLVSTVGNTNVCPVRETRGAFCITKNGLTKVKVFFRHIIYDTSDKYDMASGTAVLVLNKGDDVHVKVTSSNYYIYGR